MTQKNIVMDVNEIPKGSQWILLSIQHLFAMFGATILVPFLTDLSPAVALVSSGTGTLAYLFITRGKIPAYLGSSFAFIAPIIAASASEGAAGAMVGGFLAGIVYGLVALLITFLGTDWLMRLLPPIVVGPVIMVIGLGLAPTAVDMAMYDNEIYSSTFMLVALVTLIITIIATIFFKGFLALIPILIGIVSGYLFALFQGIVDTSQIKAEWAEIANIGSVGDFLGAIFQMPDFIIPFVDYAPLEIINLQIIFIMVPIALVTVAEHIGDQMVLSKIAGRNFLKDPGLNRSLFGDGVATLFASMIGAPPNTTYGENIGVLSITRVFSVFVIGGAAVLAILFGFIGIITATINSIPTPVMGGVSILLFGIIASNGLRMLTDNQLDLSDKRNLVISSVILVIGVGGAFIELSEGVEIAGMALSAIIGVILNLILPGKESGHGKGALFEESD
ncbi:uracil permease [Virgibacillus natechei]|uniref:Uracil permease n=1 Tax=Virgibacillus natechei TaxID=1216297 RepID=A0ABS4IBB7_9BACI|nr:solute carrier family 23 protein [Virgibacillus natechei]MBP1968175.1 uracil permease [Virgibacillus natechei]UZD14551.1 NCS2 family nucleobase:cation symporter [Virgibacillus natechei]